MQEGGSNRWELKAVALLASIILALWGITTFVLGVADAAQPSLSYDSKLPEPTIATRAGSKEVSLSNLAA